MAGLPLEINLEEHIVNYLTSQPLNIGGEETAAGVNAFEYHQIETRDYDKDLCVVKSEVIAFIKDTQRDEYMKLVDAKGSEEEAKAAILSRLDNELSQYGTIDILKTPKCIGTTGCHFDMVYWQPVSSMNEEHNALYNKNRVAIMRQFKYSSKNPDLAIDLAIFVNGLPVATIELKNTLTGQRHINAIKQYMQDRKTAGEKTLEFKRILVHFACGTEQVFMTTRLQEGKTRFFPFNQTFENRHLSADMVRTEYLWTDVLRRDSLMDLLQNYILVQKNETVKYDKKKGGLVTETSEAIIFPRYHQRRAVKRIIEDQKENGVGHRYLIEHSAGSGKSNTITWLTFRLSNMFQHKEDKRPLYDTIFVVTDRLVLNSQIGNNIKQFDRVDGQAEYVMDSEDGKIKKSSKDLESAMEKGYRIIVTNIQKFSCIADRIKRFPDKKYAVLIDEAHSSQSGDYARQMRKAMSLEEAARFDKEVEKETDEEAKLQKVIEEEMEMTGVKKNVSFFAFTATPTNKTLMLFCEEKDGRKPFDVYKAQQAIAEGFILDVLENFMTFNRYFKLLTAQGAIDSEYEKKKTVKLLCNYVDLQDTAIEKKSRIMLDHFVTQTQKEIGGEARAMLVTRSRLHAVRYKKKFDEIMQEMHLPYKALVAFSGKVKDAEDNMEYTEKSMNALEGNISIPHAFKLPKYRILIVAMKYQTGFDEPLLHTMFVDKKLGGTNTVQTLSRLNRTCKGKSTAVVLDFVNKVDDVQKDFQDYYGMNYMLPEDETDPDVLYQMQSELMHYNVFEKADVDEFARYYFIDDSEKLKVNAVLDRVCDNVLYSGILSEDEQDIFRKRCKRFSNLYKFLSQIITFKDAELAKLAPFCHALYKKLPYRESRIPYEVLDDVTLDCYKVKYVTTHKVELRDEDTALKGQTAGQDFASIEGAKDTLGNIVKSLNDTYGLELSDEDKVEMQKMRKHIVEDQELMKYFNKENSRNDVKKMFDERIDSELLDFINTKLDLYNKLSEDRANTMFKNMFFNELYDRVVRGI